MGIQDFLKLLEKSQTIFSGVQSIVADVKVADYKKAITDLTSLLSELSTVLPDGNEPNLKVGTGVRDQKAEVAAQEKFKELVASATNITADARSKASAAHVNEAAKVGFSANDLMVIVGLVEQVVQLIQVIRNRNKPAV